MSGDAASALKSAARQRKPAPGSGGRWPNLLIIGAHKAGTTSLHRYLDIHPEVRMSEHKELAYFCGPTNDPLLVSRRHLGEAWYRANFVGSVAVHGESSTPYTFYSVVRGVPQRIHGAIPDVKLIYIVRDPVDRLISHYTFVRGQSREQR